MFVHTAFDIGVANVKKNIDKESHYNTFLSCNKNLTKLKNFMINYFF